MGKNVVLTTILVLLIYADVINGAFFWSSRKLSAPSPKEVNKITVPPISSPVSGEKQSSPVGGKDGGKEKQIKKPTPALSSGDDKSKDKPVENNKGSSPPINEKEENKTPKEQVKENNENKSNLPPEGNESCDGVEKRCRDTKSMVACIKSFDNALSKALVLILNEGDSSLKVDVKTTPGNEQKMVDIAKHQNKKVEFSLANGGSNTITLNAGHGDCVLQMGAPTSQGYFPEWLPSYSKFMTPMYGAYFLLLTTIIAGMVWACCWFGKKKRHGDIPYQELEMSMPESAAAAETAEGWDQGWDDDWDEEKAVKSPGGRNISANGLTSRTPNKDGWEDWDD